VDDEATRAELLAAMASTESVADLLGTSLAAKDQQLSSLQGVLQVGLGATSIARCIQGAGARRPCRHHGSHADGSLHQCPGVIALIASIAPPVACSKCLEFARPCCSRVHQGYSCKHSGSQAVSHCIWLDLHVLRCVDVGAIVFRYRGHSPDRAVRLQAERDRNNSIMAALEEERTAAMAAAQRQVLYADSTSQTQFKLRN